MYRARTALPLLSLAMRIKRSSVTTYVDVRWSHEDGSLIEQQMDMYDFMSHADLGSWAGEGSDTWGWVGPNGREFIAIGQADGTGMS